MNEKGHDVRFLLFLLCRRFVHRPKQLGHLDLLVQVINFAFDGLFQPITRLGGVPREAMLSFDERSAKYIRGDRRPRAILRTASATGVLFLKGLSLAPLEARDNAPELACV